MPDIKRNISTSTDRIENDLERSLRPSGFEEFSGQPGIVENLKVFIAAAKQRGDALDHSPLSGGRTC